MSVWRFRVDYSTFVFFGVDSILRSLSLSVSHSAMFVLMSSLVGLERIVVFLVFRRNVRRHFPIGRECVTKLFL